MVVELAIEAETVIEPGMVAMRSVPLDDTNAMAFEDLGCVIGKAQVITPNRVAPR